MQGSLKIGIGKGYGLDRHLKYGISFFYLSRRLRQLKTLDPNGDQTEGESNGANGNNTNRGGNALDDEERIYEQVRQK